MSGNPRGRLMLVVALAALGGCAAPKQPEEPPRAGAEVVGRIATVNAAGGFALIQRLGAWDVPDETLLVVRSAERAATLRPTGERQGRYVAADLVSGEVEVGDAVIFVRPGRDSQVEKAGPEAAASPESLEL